MDKPFKDVINKAGEILRDPAARCTKTYARNEYGSEAYPFDDAACKFCLVGALERANGEDGVDILPLRRQVAALIGGDSILIANTWDQADDESQEAIVQALLKY